MEQFYFEFNENEYYGLIAVHVALDDLNTKPYKKAAEIYLNNIGGDSLEELLDEGLPNERTKEYAFMKFMYAPSSLNATVHELINEFESIKDGVLLIDSSLA